MPVAQIFSGVTMIITIGYAIATYILINETCAYTGFSCTTSDATKSLGSSTEDDVMLGICCTAAVIYAILSFFLDMTKPGSESARRVIGYLAFPAALFVIVSIVWSAGKYKVLKSTNDNAGGILSENDTFFSSLWASLIIGAISAVAMVATWIYTAISNKNAGGSYLA